MCEGERGGGIARSCISRGCNISDPFPGWGLISPVCGNGGEVGGERGVLSPFPAPSPPCSHPLTAHPSPIPTLLLQRGLPSPSPFSFSSSGVFTSSPGRRNVFPHPIPSRPGAELPSGRLSPPGIPRLPGHPHPRPGCPSPAPGEVGLCTHPLPAAVALSLETGSDSGSITFSALSLSGNFCSNPSEKGGQAGLWVHPSQELSSLSL